MKIYYWCPFIGKVATISAVINSIKSLNKFSKNQFKPSILNVVGEWNEKKNILDKYNIGLVNLRKTNIMKYLPKLGFLFSRMTYIIIFFLSASKLHNFLKEKKPDYLVVHLITFIPLFVLFFFKYETKFILRISGLPKLNIFRAFLWKKINKKIYIVTCPTLSTLDLLKKKSIFDKEKLIYLPDPIIDIKSIQTKKKSLNGEIKKYPISKENSLISIGRLTKQKNFNFLIETFYLLIKKYKNLNLIILGDGEEKKQLEEKINKLNLQKKVFLIGYKNNIFPYLLNSKIFVLSSLWEDPGFVLIEAGISNVPVMSSNCPNGPIEIIENNRNGFLYKTNSKEDFLNTFDDFIKSKTSDIKKKKINLKKKCREFTLFNHYRILKKIFR